MLTGSGRRRWVAPRWPGWLDDDSPERWTRGRSPALYRALRKGREDVKDEPGAADFYYGEMEMRRLARPPSTAASAVVSPARRRGDGWNAAS